MMSKELTAGRATVVVPASLDQLALRLAPVGLLGGVLGLDVQIADAALDAAIAIAGVHVDAQEDGEVVDSHGVEEGGQHGAAQAGGAASA